MTEADATLANALMSDGVVLNPSIAILCPSRGRPDGFWQMVASARSLADGPIEILCYLDEDDPRRDEYYGEGVRFFTGPRINLGPAYEFLRKETNADLVMMGADDIVFRDAHWDTMVKGETPEDLVCVISFNDGAPVNHTENGHPFIGRRFIEALGSITNPNLGHSMIDNWVVNIARAAKRFKRLEMLVEHVHPKFGKGVWDQTYHDNGPLQKKTDGDTYFAQIKSIENEARKVTASCR